VTRAALAMAVVGALTQPALAQPEPKVEPGDPASDALHPPADDLSKAADATAEVAAIPPPAAPDAATPAAASASPDDIELSALGLDPGAAAFDDKLNIYGFADIGYTVIHSARDPVIFPQDVRSFAIGNFNIYLAKNLTRKARALAEVRFTFMPNGSVNPDGSIVSTTAGDNTNANRPATWGGIVIDRVYVEYDVGDHLTVRAGHWLTPYGIWNIDHGSPVIIGTSRPFIIGEQFFPEHQTGLDMFGSHYLDSFKLNYHLTASNGRGGSEATADQDTELGFGGRLELETPWGFKAGGSYYRGRFTGLPAAMGAPAETYQEAAYGGDAQFDRGALHVQAEMIVRERHYEVGQRAATAAGFVPDGRDVGYYLLAGYRLDRFWNVMPFAYAEAYRPADHSFTTGGYDLNGGFNFRPAPSLVFKLQTTRIKLNDDGLGPVSGQANFLYTAQAAWVF
jgi:hypothetical protein